MPDYAAFEQRPLRSITAADVGRYLAAPDAEPSVGPRTVNKHRQVLCSVFEHAMREDTFGLAVNPRGALASAASQIRGQLVRRRAHLAEVTQDTLRAAGRPAPSGARAGRRARALRLHNLRHSFGSLVIREFELVSVKAFMGHAKITTTERHLHARPRRDDAARMTKVFEASVIETPTREIER